MKENKLVRNIKLEELLNANIDKPSLVDVNTTEFRTEPYIPKAFYQKTFSQGNNSSNTYNEEKTSV